MAAYGLYSHIQSNRRRSLALLVGLFFLVYLMVFAGALVAEALCYDAALDVLMRRALSDLIRAAPLATVGTALWIVIAYFFHQSHDRRGDRRAGGHAQGGAAALQYSGKSLHLARHHHAEAQGRWRATRSMPSRAA